jgi:hypothetical protein
VWARSGAGISAGVSIVRRRRRERPVCGTPLGAATDRHLSLTPRSRDRLFPVGLPEGHVTTPFEEWCDQSGVHPEALGAWECFSAALAEAG